MFTFNLTYFSVFSEVYLFPHDQRLQSQFCFITPICPALLTEGQHSTAKLNKGNLFIGFKTYKNKTTQSVKKCQSKVNCDCIRDLKATCYIICGWTSGEKKRKKEKCRIQTFKKSKLKDVKMLMTQQLHLGAFLPPQLTSSI